MIVRTSYYCFKCEKPVYKLMNNPGLIYDNQILCDCGCEAEFIGQHPYEVAI